MLGDGEAIATVAVRDIEAAREFYEGTLGLTLLENRGGEVLSYRSGTSMLFVYHSAYAGTNGATSVTWRLPGGVDAEVSALAAKGVRFERYEMPDTHREGDVHVSGTMRVAWFKDPDGNIHSIVSG